MTRYDKRVQALAVGLSALAGYVDALGFIELGGFFVSFMSGNSTRFAVGVAEGVYESARLAAGLIGLFVVGVVIGSLVGRWRAHRRRPAVLFLVGSLLGAAAMLGQSPVAVALMAIAMGAENAVFERDGEVHIGLTYMTGTLVKLGQRLADALTGGKRFAWAPYLLLWAGLVLGAVAGAAIYPHLGLGGLWVAAAFALALAAVAAVIGDESAAPTASAAQ